MSSLITTVILVLTGSAGTPLAGAIAVTVGGCAAKAAGVVPRIGAHRSEPAMGDRDDGVQVRSTAGIADAECGGIEQRGIHRLAERHAADHVDTHAVIL